MVAFEKHISAGIFTFEFRQEADYRATIGPAINVVAEKNISYRMIGGVLVAEAHELDEFIERPMNIRDSVG
jgi:hypothetical protein